MAGNRLAPTERCRSRRLWTRFWIEHCAHQRRHVEGRDSEFAKAIGKDRKGKVSLLIYLMAIPLAFVLTWIAFALYVAVALIWLIPDRRFEQHHH